MNDLVEKLRILAKAEALLLQMHLRRAVRQASLILAAVIFGLLALAMLNVALYLLLEPRTSPAMAAFAVAGLDLLVAVVAVAAASRVGPGPEAEAAQAIRDSVTIEVAAEADRLRGQLDDLGQDIRRIRSAVTGFLEPAGISFQAVFQWIVMIVGFLRRKRT